MRQVRDLINELIKLGIQLQARGMELTIQGSKEHLTPELIGKIREHKASLLEYLRSAGVQGYQVDQIPVVKPSASYPLSPSQRRLWILSQLEGGNVAYNMARAYLLEGDLDKDALGHTFKALIRRHENLRTVFREDQEGEPGQFITPPEQVGFSIGYRDLRKEIDRDEIAKQEIRTEFTRPFDLSSGPLVRAVLFQLEDKKWILANTVHHIISDGWSMGILIRELLTLYNSHATGEAAALVPLRIQYKDYAAWLQEQLQGDALQEQRKYWMQQLDGELPVLELPTDAPRPAVKTYNGGMIHKTIDPALTAQIRKLGQENGSTLFMNLLALVNILLYRYTGQGDILIGSPVAGRQHADLEHQIGFYLNTVALRSRFKGGDSYLEVLEECRRIAMEANEHQQYPFDELINGLSLKRDRSRSALFDVFIDFHDMKNGAASDSRQMQRLQVSRYGDAEHAVSKFDLTFLFMDSGEELGLSLEYNSDLYRKETAERIHTHFEGLLKAVLGAPGTPVSRLVYTGEEERERLLGLFDAIPQQQVYVPVTALWHDQVRKTPDHTAVIYGGISLTYRELQEKAGRLAAHLQNHAKVRPDDLVGILLDRSEKMIIAILGVLQSGAAYVPIDPAYPAARKAYVLKDTGINTLITQTEYLFDVPDYEGSIIAIDIELEGLEAAPVAPATAAHLSACHGGTACTCSSTCPVAGSAGPDDLAYVIYTSGSTGMPKGCAITLANLSYYVQWANQYYFPGDAGPNFGLYTPLSFDLTVTSIFCTLTKGGTLTVYDQHKDLTEILLDSFSAESGLDSIKLTPSHIRLLSHLSITSSTMLKAVVGGEQVTAAHVNTLKRINPAIRVYNEYGPTETTVGCMIKELDEHSPVTIGKAISGARIYILDEGDTVCPVGVTGEIAIGGPGLGRGYLNQVEMTAAKFTDDPYEQGRRIYRTGDLGKWLPDGEIEYLGRRDDQVKIRGYRIELGEVESAVQHYPGIESAVVTAITTREGEQELAAYVVSSKTLDVTDIRAFLSKNLPAYFLPAHFIQVHEIPLTVNGKVDKKRLPDPDGEGIGTGTFYTPPVNDSERLLADIFSQVLKKSPVGRKDDFFVLGGDSIKAIQIVSRLKQAGYALSIQDIMVYPVIEFLAEKVRQVGRAVEQGVVTGPVLLGPIQRSFLGSDPTDRHYYNQSVLLKSNIPLSEEGIRAALDKLVLHHDALRMTFRETPGGWVQENQGTGIGYGFEVFPDADGQAISAQGARIQASLDLEKGPLFKACLFRHSGGDRLLLVAHHLVVDGVSWRILLEDLSSLYRQFISGEALTLPFKTDSFQYWQARQLEFAQSETLRKEEPYWAGIMSRAPAPLPMDYPGGSNLVKDAVSEYCLLDEETTDKLLTRCYRAYHTDINDVLLTAVSLACKSVFRQDRVAIRLEGHGREDIGTDVDVTRTVGWFTTLYPVVFDMIQGNDPVRQLIAVKEILHRVPNKGIGYGLLRHPGRKLSPTHDTDGRGDLNPGINFNYLGDVGSGMQAGSEDRLFEWSGEDHGRSIAGDRRRDGILDFLGMVVEGRMRLSIGYSSGQYQPSTITALLTACRQYLEKLVDRLSNEEAVHLTPVDLTYRQLTVDQVLNLNRRNDLEDVYAMAPLQEGLYYHWRLSPESSAYFEQMCCRVKGKLNIRMLEKSYRELVSRHAILRTSFTGDLDGRLLQVVRKDVDNGFVYVQTEEAASPLFIEAYKQSDLAKGFNLHAGSQMRLTILGLGDNTYEFIWSHSHILMDGWCVSILIREFFQIYDSLLKNQQPVLGKVYPYASYIRWLDQVDKGASREYWRGYLSGYDTISTLLPAGTATGTHADQGYQSRQQIARLEGDSREGVRQLCSELGITENIFFQAAWSIVLAKYNNTDDVLFGAVVSGRPASLEGVEEMIGLFSNTIPVRIRPEKDLTLRELFLQVKRDLLAGSDHHYMQLADIQSGTALGRNLLDHILVFENYPVRELVRGGAEDGTGEETLSFVTSGGFEQSNYDFSLLIVPGETITLKFNYNGRLYAEDQVSRLQGHLLQVIDGVLDNPSALVGSIDCLSTRERQMLLTEFNDTARNYPKGQTILDMFESQVERTPDNIALVFEETSLTYRELNEKANQLAGYLAMKYNLQPDDLAGVRLDRSDRLVVSILAILKAGGAFMPVDTGYPAERIGYMLADSACKAVIDEEMLSVFATASHAFSKDNRSGISKPGDLAYVIYTSGTTGQPKGVMITQQAIANSIQAQQSVFNIQAGERTMQFLPSSSDVSIFEIFIALTAGATLYMVSESDKQSASLLERFIMEKGINTATIPAAYLKLMQPEKLTGLSKLITGGEAANPDDVARFTRHMTFFNAYGPTETSICASIFKIGKSDSVSHRNIPIGMPIPNTKIYIVGEQGRLQPAGIPGEICIGGAGLARGYLNHVALTAEKFVPDPFGGEGLMYKTGDLGRWLPDGNIEFAGRKDDQVKIRGHRIELEEIEKALQGHTDINAAVVLVRTGAEGDKELVAYLVPSQRDVVDSSHKDYADPARGDIGSHRPDSRDLRSWLARTLPAPMIPASYVLVDALPLTPNGKVDKRRLAEMQGIALSAGEAYVAPRNELEATLVNIWQRLLERDKIGVTDNFFEAGGNSIKIIRLSALVSEAIGKEISVALLFQYANIKDLVDFIMQEPASEDTAEFDSEGLTEDLEMLELISLDAE